MPAFRMGLIGLGKISRDQHIPIIMASEAFALVAGVSPHDRIDDFACYPTLGDMLAAETIDAVAINTPPSVRFELARAALLAEKHVLLEKPPCTTLSQLAELQRIADDRGLTLYTAWHSQHAPAVPVLRAWLQNRSIRRMTVTWREDADKWHPGQRWIWEPGGFGVFDPGINALSIVSAVTDEEVLIRAAKFDIPDDCHTPVAATLTGTLGAGHFIADFDFRERDDEIWSIAVEANDGVANLSRGGAALSIDGVPVDLDDATEYADVYGRFAALIAAGASRVDARPLSIAADAFLIARRNQPAG